MEENDKIAKEKIVSDIKNYGCHLICIESDGYLPSFVYSIGLFEKFNHPEIIVFGLDIDLMGLLINNIKDEIKKGHVFKTGELYADHIDGFKIQFLEVAQVNYNDYFGYAGWYYDSFNFPVLEFIWPDKENKWPWEENFNDNWKHKQPLLDRNQDFKYHEEKNLGVFTTNQFLNGKPILHVYHDENGDWQFHTEHEPNLSESKLMCLEEVINIDPTLNEVYFLNYGESASRDNIGGDWKIKPSNSQKSQ